MNRNYLTVLSAALVLTFAPNTHLQAATGGAVTVI